MGFEVRPPRPTAASATCASTAYSTESMEAGGPETGLSPWTWPIPSPYYAPSAYGFVLVTSWV